MKKLVILSIFIGIFGFQLVKADASSTHSNVYFFGDGKGYNVDGTQEYFCFGNGDCYSVEGVFSFVRQVQDTLTNLQNTITQLQNQVTQLQSTPQASSPIAGGEPQPPQSTETFSCNGESLQVICKSTYNQTLINNVTWAVYGYENNFIPTTVQFIDFNGAYLDKETYTQPTENITISLNSTQYFDKNNEIRLQATADTNLDYVIPLNLIATLDGIKTTITFHWGGTPYNQSVIGN